MTDREKAIVMSYTGYTMLTGDKLGIFYDYVTEKLGRSIMTHELAYDEVADEIKRAATDDFYALCMRDDTAMEAPTVNGWISVNDRSPEIGEDVLILYESKVSRKTGYAIACLEVSFYFGSTPIPYQTPQWNEPWQYFRDNNVITHWMPLPEPPKEVSEE